MKKTETLEFTALTLEIKQAELNYHIIHDDFNEYIKYDDNNLKAEETKRELLMNAKQRLSDARLARGKYLRG